MERFNNKKILNIVTILVLLGVPFIQLFSKYLILYNVISNPNIINPAIILYISVPILLFIYIKDIIKKRRKLDIFDYIFIILVISGIMSIAFSIDKKIAIFGNEYRHEGFLSVLSYYLIFINYKVNGTKEDIKKYTKIIIIIAIINSIYALLQVYTNFSFIYRFVNYFERNVNMASGLCGNPNFLGSLMVMANSIIICKMLMEKDILPSNIALLILFFTTIVLAQSTGPILALIIVFIFLIFFLHKKKIIVFKNALFIFLIMICTYSYIFFMDYVKRNIIDNSQTSIKCEMCIDGIRETIRSGGNSRLNIWKKSLPLIPKYPITGVGFDNFSLAYPNPKIEKGIKISATDILNGKQKKEKKYYIIVDNAHNVYLHTLVSTGILGFIPFLLLLLLTFIKGLKSNNKLILIIFGAFVAYSVQAFANISVIQVAPIYYLIIGLILSQKQ